MYQDLGINRSLGVEGLYVASFLPTLLKVHAFVYDSSFKVVAGGMVLTGLVFNSTEGEGIFWKDCRKSS